MQQSLAYSHHKCPLLKIYEQMFKISSAERKKNDVFPMFLKAGLSKLRYQWLIR